MTDEKKKKIIQENPDKTLNELKRIIKNSMTEKERQEFTFNELVRLITEMNKEREEQEKRVSSKRFRNTRNIEGEER